MSYAFWAEIIFTDLNADLSHKPHSTYLLEGTECLSVTHIFFQLRPFQLHLTHWLPIPLGSNKLVLSHIKILHFIWKYPFSSDNMPYSFLAKAASQTHVRQILLSVPFHGLKNRGTEEIRAAGRLERVVAGLSPALPGFVFLSLQWLSQASSLNTGGFPGPLQGLCE